MSYALHRFVRSHHRMIYSSFIELPILQSKKQGNETAQEDKWNRHNFVVIAAAAVAAIASFEREV